MQDFIYKYNYSHLFQPSGEKLTDEEVDQIFAGLEDDNGNVQYDGK
jgi:Ca2+-binding EF-hand superfamily protein